MSVNERDAKVYFPHETWMQVIAAPLSVAGMEGKYDIVATVKGGGIRGQADSIRLAIARALVATNPDVRSSLKQLGFLSRDARVKERKKYGRKKARRSPQWSKR